MGSDAARGRLTLASILLALSALAVLAWALRVRAVLPAIAASGALAAAWLAPAVVTAVAVVIALVMLALGEFVWNLLDDE